MQLVRAPRPQGQAILVAIVGIVELSFPRMI